MRQASSSKRSRGGRANGKRPNQNSRASVFESNGSDSKVKGTAAQVLEKYQAMARDAIAAGDRITAENYLQHAEHYYRLLSLQQGSEERSGGRGRSETPASPPVPIAVAPAAESTSKIESKNDGQAGDSEEEEKPGNGAADSSSRQA